MGWNTHSTLISDVREQNWIYRAQFTPRDNIYRSSVQLNDCLILVTPLVCDPFALSTPFGLGNILYWVAVMTFFLSHTRKGHRWETLKMLSAERVSRRPFHFIRNDVWLSSSLLWLGNLASAFQATITVSLLELAVNVYISPSCTVIKCPCF